MGSRLYLVLENGTTFEGEAFGAPIDRDAVGEVVFTTAMSGYVESLSDPSYLGQMLVQTFPEIGNHGVDLADMESAAIHMRGYIVKNRCDWPSHYRSKLTVDELLKRHGVPGLAGADTRQLTRLIREKGTMNGALTRSPQTVDLAALACHSVGNAVPGVGAARISRSTIPGARMRVAVWDFGATSSMIRQLSARGIEAVRMPWNCAARDILSERPDGVLLSSGPGDPAENEPVFREIGKLTQSGVPIFGICLGHQLLALSQGAKTEKLKYGHRGANHPVWDVENRRVYITNQNHGYAVRMDALPRGARVLYENLNDGTCEGLVYQGFPALSVQFHPEANAGPKDTLFLFDRFVRMMEQAKEVRAV